LSQRLPARFVEVEPLAVTEVVIRKIERWHESSVMLDHQLDGFVVEL